MRAGGLQLAERGSAGSAIDEARNVQATPAQLLAWAQGAGKGDEFAYVTRSSRMLPAGSSIAAAARELSERGLVTLVQRRIPDRAEKNYVARRTGAPWSVPTILPAPAKRSGRGPDAEAAAVNALMPILRQHARFVRPCPTDAQLAARAGIARGEVAATLKVMEMMGLIRVQAAPAPTLRQVTIVATGHRTGMIG